MCLVGFCSNLMRVFHNKRTSLSLSSSKMINKTDVSTFTAVNMIPGNAKFCSWILSLA